MASVDPKPETRNPKLFLDCGGRPLDLGRAAIMGILNVTPDSFSDGGQFLERARALAHAECMVEEGADIIDVGGESTRPGAQAVAVEEELDRVVPVIEALRARVAVPISVDTSKPEVMRVAVAAGAGLINDVYALRRPGALAAAAALGVPVCLMHMQGEPRGMQDDPRYGDVVEEVGDFLAARIDACVAAGIPRARLLADPGFGFGKTTAHNLELLRRLGELAALGVPLLAGLSRKSVIGKVLGLAAGERLYASLALALIAVQNGARIVRVHDVRATREVLRMAEAVAHGA
jgi:dihydropteroate synthase